MLQLLLGGSGSGKTTLLYQRIRARAEKGEKSILLVPEQFTSSTEGRIYRELGDALSGMVESVTFKGVHFEMSVTVYGQEWLIHSTQSQEVGSVIEIRLDPEDIHIMKKMEE